MKYRQGWYWSLFLFWVLFMLVAATGVEYLNRYQQQYLNSIELEDAREDLSLVRSRLESLVFSDIYILSSLPAQIALNPKLDQPEWDNIAHSIQQRSRHIRVLGLAPNDVVEYVYPPTGNESVLGLDYRTIPEQWSSILKAKSIKETFIAGPVSLFQGGQALIIRMPIFTDPPVNQKYWGVCSVVIDLQTLFEDAGVYRLNQHYNIALRGVDSTGDMGAVFFGQPSTFTDSFASENIHFPYGHWVIAAAAKGDFLSQINWYQVHGARLIGYGALLAISLSFIAVSRMYHKANQRSLHDELTGLPNRRYFMFTIQHQFALATSSLGNESFALVNIDVDKFKWVNDKFGHDAGDKVLIATAKRIQGALRASDIVARVGGDEFLLLLPRVMTEHDVESITNTILKAISNQPVFYDNHAINISVSIGYALFDKQYHSIEDMFKLADSRMYQAKKRS
ncbi:GGDEF family protein [Vibrio ichthyoenteri ATCC 700023]|uniref:GGDEF family protein n=1 Tax=Vibrio ichthyoenteri ATCC 700023 TaxID=870968 RepID=F9S311_9VIBR|nr:diguanylate cyclase [Vibrio ichthyoenteri]EGU38570.1 GGDEF family protein [Vibrio ichthyoenteri ATCC 700023]